MISKQVSILSLLLILILISQGITASDNSIQKEFYISPEGNDNNSGTRTKPFQTITRARMAVREINDDMTGDIIVYFRDGKYLIEDTITFNEKDSGTNGFQVIYRAYPGEKPIISGGKRITGWSQAKNKSGNNLWQAKVPDIKNTRDFFVNGKRATMARSEIIKTIGWELADNPDIQFFNKIETFTTYQGKLPVYEGYKTTKKYSEMINWRNPEQIEFVYDAGWTHCILPVANIELAETGSGVIVKMKMPAFRDAQIKGGMHIKDPNYMQNVFAFLDEPGEWYLDQADNIIYYIPEPGQDMKSAEIIVPTTEKLIIIQGTLAEPVHDIKLKGLSFEYTTFLRPNKLGHAEIQANFIKNPAIDLHHTSTIKTPGGIILDAAKNVIIEECSFDKFGAGGLDLQNGARNNIIRGNKFINIGASGVQIGGVHHTDAHPEDKQKIVKDNVITCNYFDNIGTEFKGSIAIFSGYTDGTIISHNEITNVAYTGISVGWGWGLFDEGGRTDDWADDLPRYQEPTVAKDNLIEYNHIHHVMQKLHDGAGIYTLSMMPGTVIRHNLIHDNNLGWPGGIYLDEGSGGIEVTENIVYNVKKPYNYHDVGIEGRQATCKVHDNYFYVHAGTVEYPEDIAQKAGLPEKYEKSLKNTD